MHAIHPKARTTPAVRAEIARSSEPTGVLAKRFGVSTETIRKGRKREGAQARTGRLPGPLRPASHAALESQRGGAGHRRRAAPRNRLPA